MWQSLTGTYKIQICRWISANEDELSNDNLANKEFIKRLLDENNDENAGDTTGEESANSLVLSLIHI